MGVDISELVYREQVSIKAYENRVMAVDAFNILYQFLSSVRQADGTPLMDSKGRITSHLSGCFYRNINLLENGIRPVYVFDGKPSRLKANTIRERMEVKERAREELEIAREKGDLERVRSLSARVTYLTRDMVEDVKQLLIALGIPYIQAPSEGEGQASYMCRTGQAYGVISQDYDCLLFGASRVFRNFTTGGRRKVPGRNIYVPVSPELLILEETLSRNEITYDQLIDIGIMVGTDFNTGLARVGAKTALKLVKKYGNIQTVLKERGEVIENLEEIKDIFRKQNVIESPTIAFGKPDAEKIKKILCDDHDFDPARVDPYITLAKEKMSRNTQTSLDGF